MAGPRPRLFGADYSVYVRIARLAFAEKGVDYELVPVDIFDPSGVPDWYRKLHPFSKIPALEHGDVRLFETGAITRYIDQAFEGPALQPDSTADRAVMNQVMAVIDNYGYRAMVWDVYVERISKPADGKPSDEKRVAEGLEMSRKCLSVLAELKGSRTWLAANSITLADIHAIPVFAYFLKTAEGAELLRQHQALRDWWNAASSRDSFNNTVPTD